MSDITISYKGNSIATMDATGSKTLLTEGKYCEDDIEVAYVKPGGGSSVESGSFTPATNTSHTFEMGSLKHLAFLAETSPYGTGVRTMAAGILDIDNNSAAVRSNTGGSSAAGWYGARFYTLSGTTVTVGDGATPFYFIAGITYDWWAW